MELVLQGRKHRLGKIQNGEAVVDVRGNQSAVNIKDPKSHLSSPYCKSFVMVTSNTVEEFGH